MKIIKIKKCLNCKQKLSGYKQKYCSNFCQRTYYAKVKFPYIPRPKRP